MNDNNEVLYTQGQTGFTAEGAHFEVIADDLRGDSGETLAVVITWPELGTQELRMYHADGRYFENTATEYDLTTERPKRTLWVNLFQSGSATHYATQEAACKAANRGQAVRNSVLAVAVPVEIEVTL
jgi:hypothetical protein